MLNRARIGDLMPKGLGAHSHARREPEDPSDEDYSAGMTAETFFNILACLCALPARAPAPAQTCSPPACRPLPRPTQPCGTLCKPSEQSCDSLGHVPKSGRQRATPARTRRWRLRRLGRAPQTRLQEARAGQGRTQSTSYTQPRQIRKSSPHPRPPGPITHHAFRQLSRPGTNLAGPS